jgi:hypothetical protein
VQGPLQRRLRLTAREIVMAKESIIFELNTETNWDGTSLTGLDRDQAIVTGQRHYRFSITGPHGVLAPDLGGLFSPTSAKLVGIGYGARNPASRGRVITATGTIRQEFGLTPALQYVVVHPGDQLAFVTRDDGRAPIVLSVNEMNEQDAVTWGLGHEPKPSPTRFRIIRDTGTAFAPNLASLWLPNFVRDPATGLLTAHDNATGMIPTSALAFDALSPGCYVAIRYAGHNNNGKLHIVDNPTRRAWIAEAAMPDVKWTKVQFVSHDDGIALEATPAVAGQLMVCDIEVMPVQGDRLCGRYTGSL